MCAVAVTLLNSEMQSGDLVCLEWVAVMVLTALQSQLQVVSATYLSSRDAEAGLSIMHVSSIDWISTQKKTLTNAASQIHGRSFCSGLAKVWVKVVSSFQSEEYRNWGGEGGDFAKLLKVFAKICNSNSHSRKIMSSLEIKSRYLSI